MRKLRAWIVGIAMAFAVPLASAAENETDLLKQAQKLFRPLNPDMATPQAPITKERADLGRMLFFDPRITIDAKLSCSSCHQPARYGTDGLAKSMGVRQRPHPRNALPCSMPGSTSSFIGAATAKTSKTRWRKPLLRRSPPAIRTRKLLSTGSDKSPATPRSSKRRSLTIHGR